MRTHGPRDAATAAAAALSALLLAGGGYALASGGRTVKVCIHKHGRGLYAGHCARHDRTLTWDAVGPPGAQGRPGSQGPAGQPGPPGPGGGGTGLIFAGNAFNTVSNSHTVYVAPGEQTLSTIETVTLAPSPVAFSAQDLVVVLDANPGGLTAPGGGGAYVFTLRLNGVSTALRCTVTDPSPVCVDSTDAAAVAQGNVMDISIAPSHSPAPTNQPGFSLSFAAK